MNRPEWADRLRREREARDWTQEDVVRAMRTAADRPLPEDLLTTYKRYEPARAHSVEATSSAATLS